MISSKSGTLYAISHAPKNVYDLGDFDDHAIGDIYAMDDLTRGWKQIECRKSERTQQIDPFKLPKLSHKLPQGVYQCDRMSCWEINEHDILLVVLQSLNLGMVCGKGMPGGFSTRMMLLKIMVANR